MNLTTPFQRRVGLVVGAAFGLLLLLAPTQIADAHPPDESDHRWQYDPEASFYGPGLYGNRTACGQVLRRDTLGVAHRSLPCGTLVRFEFTDHEPGRGDGIRREIVVRVIDRGPYHPRRTWDLTAATCHAIRHCFTGPLMWTR